MHIIIGIVIVIAIIYGIIKLIIFLAPYIGIGLLFILGVGGAIGLLVGVFFGIRNYILSIRDNISNKTFKFIMMAITIIVIIIILLYSIAIAYFLYSYSN